MTLGAGSWEFLVLPTPLLPTETLLDCSGGFGARASYEPGESLGQALAADRRLLRDPLAKMVAPPACRVF